VSGRGEAREASRQHDGTIAIGLVSPALSEKLREGDVAALRIGAAVAKPVRRAKGALAERGVICAVPVVARSARLK
jgi:hypothetical protein